MWPFFIHRKEAKKKKKIPLPLHLLFTCKISSYKIIYIYIYILTFFVFQKHTNCLPLRPFIYCILICSFDSHRDIFVFLTCRTCHVSYCSFSLVLQSTFKLINRKLYTLFLLHFTLVELVFW